MVLSAGKRIADAVHGTIELSEAETAVISTRAYQRLRGVKHLGLASLVFPGADYSRFAHGVGTCHVTGQILSNLAANTGQVTGDDVAVYGMAALLHDVGHYPFSHTFERALRDHYASTSLLDPGDGGDDDDTSELEQQYWYHEELGTHVIAESEELAGVLQARAIDGEELSRIITREDPPKFTNLVSSDLDADRTDYLMRTAHHTGLPYGNVDLPYLLSQIRLDDEQRICFTSKGMRAAEHLLLSRYFDYQQVSYHKTVAGLELLLNDAISVLLRHGLDCRPKRLREMIGDGRWDHFDDALITSAMREQLLKGQLDDIERLKLSAILTRRPPKVVVDREVLATADLAETFGSLDKLAAREKTRWEERWGAPFYIWKQAGNRLTKIGSTVPVSALGEQAEEDSYDKLLQAVRVLKEDGKTSQPIQKNRRSLVHALSQHALYGLRVYVLLPPEREGERQLPPPHAPGRERHPHPPDDLTTLKSEEPANRDRATPVGMPHCLPGTHDGACPLGGAPGEKEST